MIVHATDSFYISCKLHCKTSLFTWNVFRLINNLSLKAVAYVLYCVGQEGLHTSLKPEEALIYLVVLQLEAPRLAIAIA